MKVIFKIAFAVNQPMKISYVSDGMPYLLMT